MSGALDILDRPGRAARGALIGTDPGNRLGIANPLEGATKGLLAPAEETLDYNVATWLERQGLDGPENEWTRNILGFAGDVALDPTNLLGVGVVRSAIGRGAQAARRGAGALPAGRGRTLGDVGRAVEGNVGVPLARRFSQPVLGTDLTHWELRRLARQGDITPQAARRIEQQNRAIQTLRLDGDTQAIRDIHAGLRAEGVEEQTLTRLRRNPDFQRQVSSVLFEARQRGAKYEEMPAELDKLGLTGLGRYIEKTYRSNAAEVPLPNELIDDFDQLNVAGAVDRYLAPRVAKEVGGDAREEAFRQTLRGEAFYWRYTMPSWNDMQDTINLNPALQDVLFTGKTTARTPGGRKLTAQQLIDAGADTDVLKVMALDRADTLLKARVSAFMSDDLLQELGVRRIDPNLFQSAANRIERAGIPRDQVLQVLKRFRAGEIDDPTATAEITARLAGLTDQRGVDLSQQTAEELIQNVRRPDEASYALNDGLTMLKEIQSAAQGVDADEGLVRAAGALADHRQVADGLRVPDGTPWGQEEVIRDQMRHVMYALQGSGSRSGATIARATQQSRREVRGYLQALEEQGIVRRADAGGWELSADTAEAAVNTANAGRAAASGGTEAIHRQASMLAGPADVIKMYSTLRNPMRMGGLSKTLDYANAFWKPLTTVAPVNTVYFVRNQIGALLNVLIRGRMPIGEVVTEMPVSVSQVLNPSPTH